MRRLGEIAGYVAMGWAVMACGIGLAEIAPALAQENPGGPTDAKAQKTYQDGLKFLAQRDVAAAINDFKKADKQDGGHCWTCQEQILKAANASRDWKAAEYASQAIVAEADKPSATALAHYEYGWVLVREGIDKHKDDAFARGHEEFTKAIAAVPKFPDAVFADGQALAYTKQDDVAKAQFQKYLEMAEPDARNRPRAARFISEPSLARARMAPAFQLTTIDGQEVSIDSLAGKAVLLDFWATWCGPCREALPHMKEIAKTFQGEALVILSVSLDGDEGKWKTYVAENGMTWLQDRDGGFEGPISRLFSVNAIPHTFTIDADGVLQDEQIGDASIEGKLKKLCAHARELQPAAPPAKPAGK
jgi:thiol-disulfide isomerase/thioredoxin